MRLSNNQQAFLELVRAGLWEKEARLLPFGVVNYNEVMRFAEMQSVDGLITAGIEHVQDVKVPQEIVLQLIGQSLQIEQRNREMNDFIATIIEKMRKADIYGLLVKGSGLAQCYERPLWRSCGDIDLFFSINDYNRAINFFTPLSSEVFQNTFFSKSYGLIIDDWVVELHGTLRCGLSSKLVRETDSVQKDIFYGGDVRSWINDKTQVFLPGINSDLFFLFTHFIRHFYHHEFVMRQLCDWCRFLWTYRGQIDVSMLEKRLLRSGVMDEWKVFGAFTVAYLGMPVDAMPFYSEDKRNLKKAKKILVFIMSGGYKGKVRATLDIAKIFPWSTLRFSPAIFLHLNWLKVRERMMC